MLAAVSTYSYFSCVNKIPAYITRLQQHFISPVCLTKERYGATDLWSTNFLLYLLCNLYLIFMFWVVILCFSHQNSFFFSSIHLIKCFLFQFVPGNWSAVWSVTQQFTRKHHQVSTLSLIAVVNNDNYYLFKNFRRIWLAPILQLSSISLSNFESSSSWSFLNCLVSLIVWEQNFCW